LKFLNATPPGSTPGVCRFDPVDFCDALQRGGLPANGRLLASG